MRAKNYYRVYRKCPDCGKTSVDNKIYFKCKDSDCSYIEKQYIRVKKQEEEDRKTVIKMVKSCLVSNPPQVKFPASAYSKEDGMCAGWYIISLHTVNIPRKAFALPRKQLTDIVAHECSHADSEASEKDLINSEDNSLIGWNDSIAHGPAWHDKYIKNYNQLTNEFSDWINQQPHKARYSLEEEIPNPNSDYRINFDDIKYDPYEDD